MIAPPPSWSGLRGVEKEPRVSDHSTFITQRITILGFDDGEIAVLERAPFKLCPKCSTDNALGTLWVGGTSLTRRCKNCGNKIYYELPKLRKKIIYLDQNAISNIFNVSSSK